jgi:hypothetical protein
MSFPKRPKRTRRATSARKQWQRFIEKFVACKTEKIALFSISYIVRFFCDEAGNSRLA